MAIMNIASLFEVRYRGDSSLFNMQLLINKKNCRDPSHKNTKISRLNGDDP